MNKKQTGGLGNDMGKLLERKEKQAKKQIATSAASAKSTSDDDSVLIETIFNKVKDQPRISFWDLESKIILNYLRETEPKFSISNKISTILQDHFEKEYPELWSEIKDLKKK